jgi:ankyrin repeat protein
MTASLKGWVQTVEILLKYGALAHLKNRHGWTALHQAVLRGHVPIIELLLNACPELIRMTTNNGRLPHHVAALNGQFDALKVLLIHNAPYEIVDSSGSTLFLDAVQSGHVDMVHYLVECHVNVLVKDKNGMNAVHLAAQRGHFDMLKYLLTLKSVQDWNSLSNYGYSALTYTLIHQHMSCHDLLLDNGFV